METTGRKGLIFRFKLSGKSCGLSSRDFSAAEFDQRGGKFNSATIFWKIRGDLTFISRNNVSLISLKRLLY